MVARFRERSQLPLLAMSAYASFQTLRAQGVAGRPSRVDLLRLGDRRPAVRRQKGVDRAVERRDPIQRGFCACPGSQVSPPDGGDQFDGGEFGGLHA